MQKSGKLVFDSVSQILVSLVIFEIQEGLLNPGCRSAPPKVIFPQCLKKLLASLDMLGNFSFVTWEERTVVSKGLIRTGGGGRAGGGRGGGVMDNIDARVLFLSWPV